MKLNPVIGIIIVSLIAGACKTTPQEKKPGAVKEGIIKEYWDDKSLKGTGPVKNGEKNGKWTLYHKGTGEKLAEGNYVNNKQEGPWVFFYKNGKKSTEGVFSEEQKTGEWLGYHETGELMWKANFVIKEKTESGFTMKIGGIEGIKISYFKNGKVWKEEEFHDGVKNGRSQEYYEDGKPKEISWFKNNEKDGRSNEWYESGKKRFEGFNQKNKKTGKWRFFHDNGQLSVNAEFEANKPDGKWEFYSRDGLLQKEGFYKAGKEAGLWTYYSYINRRRQKAMELSLMGGMVSGGINRIYDNGALVGEGELNGITKGLYEMMKNNKSMGIVEFADPPADDRKSGTEFRWTGKWKAPKKNGKWSDFYPGTKNKKTEATYMMDRLNGPYKEFYPNGTLKAEGEYMTGKKNGEWKFYLQNGTLDTVNSGRYMLDKKSKF